MKSLILAGASRSGKTTLARRMQKETGFSFISADALICSFEHIYPQLGIQHNLDFEGVTKALEPVLIDYIEHLRLYQNIFYILDIFHLMPEQIVKHGLHEKCNVAFFGYPSMDPQKKLENIRTYKTEFDDWTDDETDADMLENIRHFITWSQKLERDCAQYGLPFTP